MKTCELCKEPIKGEHKELEVGPVHPHCYIYDLISQGLTHASDALGNPENAKLFTEEQAAKIDRLLIDMEDRLGEILS